MELHEPAVLLLSEEPHVARALLRELRRRFSVEAASFEQLLREAEAGALAVIASERAPPGLVGLNLLTRPRARGPELQGFIVTPRLGLEPAGSAGVLLEAVYRAATTKWEQALPPREPTPGPAPLSVLLVADHLQEVPLLRDLLNAPRGGAIRLEWADDLERGLERLAREPLDVVLLDLRPSEAGGLEALRRLGEAAPEPPVVVLSPLDDEDLALRAMRAGAQDYLLRDRCTGEVLGRVLRYAAERGRLLARAREEAASRAEVEADRRRIESILASITDGFFALDADWRLTYVNPQAEPLLHHPVEELLGKTLWEAFPEAVGTQFEEQYRRVMRERVAAGFEAYYPPFDTWYAVRAFPTAEEGLSVYFRDISDRKRAEAEREVAWARLKAVLEQMPSGVALAEAPSGRMVLYNAEAERLLGHGLLPVQDTSGYSRYKALHPDGTPYAPEEHPLARALAGERVRDHELRYQRDVGDVIDLSVNAAPIRDPDGHIVAAVTTFLDISERKRRHAELRRQAELLELTHDTIFAWTFEGPGQPGPIAYWNRAAEQLYGYDKDEALGQVSHELLRTQVPHGSTAASEEVLARDGEWRGELLHTTRQGREILVESRQRLIHETGGPPLVLESSRDITEQRRAEAALRGERNFTAAVLETVGALVVVLDRTGRIVRVNRACEQLTGYTAAEMEGRSFVPLLIPLEEAGSVQRVFQRLLEEQVPSRHENNWVTRDGTRRRVDWRNTTLLDEGGQVRYIIGTGVDVTEQRRAAQALRESEERFRATFEQAAVGFAHVDLDGRLLRVNQRMCDLTGYTSEELMRLTFQAITHPEDLDADVAQARQLLAGDISSYSMEKRYVRKDGAVVWANLTGSLVRTPEGRPEYFIAVVEDIGPRKQAEAERAVALARERAAMARAEAEARFRAVLEAAPDAMLVTDQEGRIALVNGQVENLFGYERDALVGQPVEVLLPAWPHKRHERHRNLPRRPGARAVGAGLELRARRRDGTEVPVEISLGPLRTEEGMLVITAVRDVTRRKQAEEARARAEERLRLLAEAGARLGGSLDVEATARNAAQLLVRGLADLSIVLALEGDPSAVRLLAEHHARPEREAETRPRVEEYLQRLHPEELERLIQQGRPVLVRTDTDEQLLAPGLDTEPVRALRASGFRSCLFIPMRAEEKNGGHGTLLLALSTSERRYAESDLALAEEIGRRASVAIENARLHAGLQQALRAREAFFASVTHDLRNPLNAIDLSTELLKRQLSRGDVEPERLLERVSQMERSSARMRAFVGELLDVARLEAGQPLVLERRPTDLVAMARSAAMEHQPHGKATHCLAVEARVPELVGDWDAHRLARVLDNLLSNALKYSPAGTLVTVTVDREEDAAGHAWALLSVRDQGVGIPERELPHVLERYHRASNVQHIAGTGLGLWGTLQLVKQHGGTLGIESREGQGSTFTIRLPLEMPSKGP